VDLPRKAWAERNICTWVLGFEISSPLPGIKFFDRRHVSKRVTIEFSVACSCRQSGDQDICDSADHTFAGHFFVGVAVVGEFDRRKRIGTNESLLNQAITALAASSPTIHAPDDVFARGEAKFRPVCNHPSTALESVGLSTSFWIEFRVIRPDLPAKSPLLLSKFRRFGKFVLLRFTGNATFTR
jgi:hypothetical protein